MKKRLAAVTTVLAMILAFLPTSGLITYADGSSSLNVDYHTAEQIRDFAKSHPASLNQTVTYAENPSVKAPFKAGKLSDDTLKSALNMVNQIRYIAGLPSNVKLNDHKVELAQTAAMLNAANKKLSHEPKKPEGIDETLYMIGAYGSIYSNLAYNFDTLNKAIVEGWMDDSDSSNISSLGHRRWILDPDMGVTGFGEADRYYTMGVMDDSADTDKFTNVAWPAQNTPVEYFSGDQAWSLSTGREIDKASVKVELKRISDNKVWNFSSSKSDGEFYVNNEKYGLIGCIVFKPSNLTIKDGDSFEVKITGAGSEINYTVKFFSLNSSSDPTSSSTDKSSSTSDKTTTTTSKPKTYLEVTGNNVNVRSGAGTNHGVITMVKKGQKLEYTSTKTVSGKKWYQVKVGEKKGWIIGTYVKVIENKTTTTTSKTTSTDKRSSTSEKTTTTTSKPKTYLEVTGNNVNVRSGAGTNHGAITTVKKGQKLEYTSTKTVDGKKWYQVKVGEKKGWIIGTYVKVVENKTTTTTSKTTSTDKSSSTSEKTTTTTSKPKTYLEVTGNNVNVRSGAGTNHGAITTVKKGQKLEYTSTKTVDGKKWYQVKVGEKKGWIIGTYVKAVENKTTTTTSKTASTDKSSSTSEKTTTTTSKPKTYLEVTGNNVNVRSGAGTNYGVITKVKKGQKLEYTSTKTVDGKKWYQIKVGNKKGWIIGTYVKVLENKTTTKKTTTTKASKKTIQVTGDVVNVRSGAGKNNGAITTVKRGQKFEYSETKTVNGTKWYKINANGKTGWIIGTYVKA